MLTEIQKAVAAIKVKDYITASRLLWEVIDEDPLSDDAYYWLSVISDSPEQKLQLLEQALVINESNILAKRALDKLVNQSQAQQRVVDPILQKDTSSNDGRPLEPIPVASEAPKSEVVTFESLEPELVASETPKSEVVTFESLEPELVASEMLKSEVVTFESPEPELVASETPKSEIVTFESPEPELVASETPKSEVGRDTGPRRTREHKKTGHWDQPFADERSVVQKFEADANELLQMAIDLPEQADSVGTLRFALRKYAETEGKIGRSGIFLAPAVKAADMIVEGLLAAGRYGDAHWAANTYGEICKILLSRNPDKYKESFDWFVLAACRACSGAWLASSLSNERKEDQIGEIGSLCDRLLTLCQFALGTLFRPNEGRFQRNFKPDEELRDWAINQTLARHFEARLHQLLEQDRTRIGEYARANLPIVYKLQLDSSWDARYKEWEQLLIGAGYGDLLEDLRSRGELVRVDKVGVMPPERIEETRRAASSGDMKRVRELLRDSADELKYYLFNEAQRRLDFRQPRAPQLPERLNAQFASVRRVTQKTDPDKLRDALRVARDVWNMDITNIVLRDWVAYLQARTANTTTAEQMLNWIRINRPARENFVTDWNLAVLHYQRGAEAEAYKLLLPLLGANSTDQDLVLVTLALSLKLADRERFLSLVPQTLSLQFHALAIVVALDLNDRKRAEELLGQFLRQGEEQWKLPPMSAQFKNFEAFQDTVNRAIVEGQVDQLLAWLRGRINQQRRWVPNHIELARVLEQERQDINGAFQSLTTVLDLEKRHTPRNQRFIDDAARALLEFCRRHKRSDLGERAFKDAESSYCSQDLLESFSNYRTQTAVAPLDPSVVPTPPDRIMPPDPPRLVVDPALADRVIWVNARLTTIQKVRQYVDESRAIDELCSIVSQISPEARDTLVKLIQDTSAVIEEFARAPREEHDRRRFNYDRAIGFEKRLSGFLAGGLPSNLADVIAPYHKALRSVLGNMSKEAGIGPNVQATLLNEFISLDPSQSTLVVRVSNESERIATNVSVDLTLDSPVLRLAERRPRTIASLEAQGSTQASQVLTFVVERNFAAPVINVREIGVNISLQASAEGFPDHDLGVLQRSIPVRTLRDAVGEEMIPKLFQPSRPLNPQQPELFKGRDIILGRIGNTFKDGIQRERFFLDGIRRVGKTSILNFLPAYLPATVAPVSVNLDNLAVTSVGITSPILLHRFCQLITDSAMRAGNIACTMPDRAGFEASPGEAFAAFVSALRAGWPGRVPLLMIDELQVLLQAVQRCGSGRDQDTLVLDLLRGYMDDGAIMGIFTGSVRYEKLTSIIQHRIIGSLDRLRISFLDEDSAAAVLDAGTQPWAKLPRETVHRVHELTGGYPRLVQTYGAGLVDLMNREHRTVASPADVDAVTYDAILGNDELFMHWWPTSQLGQDEALFVETLFRNYPDRSVVATREFLDSVSYRDKQRFSEALTNLRACEVIDSTRTDQLRFTGVVLRQWLQNQMLDGHLRIRRPDTGATDTGQAGLFIDHENLIKSLERISRNRGVAVPSQGDGVGRLAWFRPILDRLYAEAERRLGRIDHKVAVAFWDRDYEARLTPPYQKYDILNKSPQAVKMANAADFKLADEVTGAVSKALTQNSRLARAVVITGDGDLSQSIQTLVNQGVSVQIWGGSKETNAKYNDIVGDANVVVLDDVCGL